MCPRATNARYRHAAPPRYADHCRAVRRYAVGHVHGGEYKVALPNIKVLIALVLIAGSALLAVAVFLSALAYLGRTEAMSLHEGGMVLT